MNAWDVCQVSVWEIHDDENGIVERIVVEVVDVVKLTDDGWWDVKTWRLEGCGGVGWT